MPPFTKGLWGIVMSGALRDLAMYNSTQQWNALFEHKSNLEKPELGPCG